MIFKNIKNFSFYFILKNHQKLKHLKKNLAVYFLPTNILYVIQTEKASQNFIIHNSINK